MNKDDEMKDLLMELESDMVEFNPTSKKKVSEIPTINEGNMEDVLMDRLGGLITTLEAGSETLSDRLEAGDTYESTVIGLSQLTGNLLNVVKVLDDRKKVRDKRKHDKEMQTQAHLNRKAEIELRAKLQPEKIGNNNTITQNNFSGFVGNQEDFIKTLKNATKSEVEVIDVS